MFSSGKINNIVLIELINAASINFTKEKLEWCDIKELLSRENKELVVILKKACSMLSALSMENVINHGLPGKDKSLLKWYTDNEYKTVLFFQSEFKYEQKTDEIQLKTSKKVSFRR